MKTILIGLKMLLAMTLLLGVAYPVMVTVIGRAFFHDKAEGSLLRGQGMVVLGSSLLAQEFKTDRYFHPRPSAVTYNPLPSGGSNLGWTSKDLVGQIEERRKAGAKHDLLYASGSGLDPHVSPEAAASQIKRVAAARGLPESAIEALVAESVEGRQFGFLGEEKVNVLLLNLKLDRIGARKNEDRTLESKGGMTTTSIGVTF